MLIQEHADERQQQIEAWRAGRWQANGQIHTGPVYLDAEGQLHVLALAAPTDLDAAHVDAALAAKPEVILVGTGARQQFLHPSLAARAAAAGVGVECMNTEAACRTSLLLHSEGRRVWAWLW